MHYPCRNEIKLRRIAAFSVVLMLLCSALTGCFGSGSSDETSESTGNLPNLVDNETQSTTAATTETAESDIPENTAIVKEQVNVRSTPSSTSPVIAQLDAGTQSQVLMLKTVHGIVWAYMSQGWVPADSLDMSHVTLTADSTETPASSTESSETASTSSAETTKATETSSSDSTESTGKSYGVVTANELNIRSEADAGSTRVGSYTYGTRLTFTETGNGWGKTNKGWVSLKYVYMDGDSGSNGCTGTVTAEGGLNVRSGPGTNYDKVKTLSNGEKITVKERIKIDGTYWGYVSGGWISMRYVDVDGEENTNDNADDGNTDDTVIGTGTVTSDGLNIRSGAGTDYDIVGSLEKGARVSIQETQTIDGKQWGRISQGWISLTYVDMD